MTQNTNDKHPSQRCLVTGATGYVGGRLAPLLAGKGFQVTVLARQKGRLGQWSKNVNVVVGDATNPKTLAEALKGTDCAYYLLHAIGTGPGFSGRENQTATEFAKAAAKAGVKQIVYLGGIANDHGLSEHLASRAAVGAALKSTGVPVIEFRAGVILGSGSASFEMLRYLTERLPLMVAPRWIANQVTPIAIRDVLGYLERAARLPKPECGVYDIGGTDTLTYEAMMQRYAQLAGMKPRRILRVGVLTPKLSSHWVGLVTPVPASLAKPLVRSLINDAVANPKAAPTGHLAAPQALLGFDEAVTVALESQKHGPATSWSDANLTNINWAAAAPSDPEWAGGTVLRDTRQIQLNAPSEKIWPHIERIGGTTGWYGANWAWRLRGVADQLVGGVGLRRGRRHSDTLHVGDAVDFWRVAAIDRGHQLTLRAEMKLPGEAWLRFEIREQNGHTHITQTAEFAPKGLAGLAYWAFMWPFHQVVFPQMLHRLARAAGA